MDAEIAALDSPSVHERYGAVQRLRGLGCIAVPHMIRIFRDSTKSTYARLGAIHVIAKIAEPDDHEAIQALQSGLGDCTACIRIECIRALGEIGSVQSIEKIRFLSADIAMDERLQWPDEERGTVAWTTNEVLERLTKLKTNRQAQQE